MALFILSFLLVFTASFFLAITFEKKSFIKFFIYLLLTAFANVILTFELLSLFSSISQVGILICNMLFAVGCFLFWYKNKKTLPAFQIKAYLSRIWNSLWLDKYLLVLGLAFIFMCGVSLWLISFMPVVNPDAEAYHVVRSLFWISQGNLNHFDYSDIRAIVLPINSEILYAWLLIFLKKQMWFGAVSFSGFLLTLASLWGILTNIGLSVRRRLWVILILSSFASVIVQISGTETDIIISGLVISSMYLFWEYLKKNSKILVFMSALAYALAVGTKTPAIMLIPGVGLWMSALAFYYHKKDFCKYLGYFIAFAFLSFILFSSYNYVLNFIDYGNIAGSKSFMEVHVNEDGLLALPANFIKYIFMFFDFTGFRWNEYVGNYIVQFKEFLLSTLGLSGVSDGLYSLPLDSLNQSLIEPVMGMGILGFALFLPCWFVSLIKPIFIRNKQVFLIFSFAMVLFFAVSVMSLQINYMVFSIRFLTCFCIIAAPILACSYFKKNSLFKFIVVFFALFYLIFVSTNLWARSAYKIYKYFKQGATISQVRSIAHCSGFYKSVDQNPELINNYPIFNEVCTVRDNIKSIDKKNKILFLSSTSDSVLLIKLLEFEGYSIDFNIIENLSNIDFKKYNLILVMDDVQQSTNVVNFDKVNSNYKYIVDGVICGYFDRKDKLIISKGKYPYKVLCSLEPLFYKIKGYRHYKSFFFKKKEHGKYYDMEFKFYENINNPVITN